MIQPIFLSNLITAMLHIMFIHVRKYYNGSPLLTWLTQPSPILMKNHIHVTKYESIVQEVELTGTNSDYAHIKLSIGRETTISIPHLVLKGDTVIPGHDVEFLSI